MDDSLTPGRKGNLTGSARKLKDNAADWHNFILKWERLNDEGSATATKIVNLVLSKEPMKEMNLLAGADTDQSVTPPVGADTLKSVKDLEEECTKLQEIVEKMAHIVSKIEKIVSSEKGICDLETFQFGAKGRDCPLFLTWPTSEFVDVSTRLCKCYRQELALKQLILRELAHTSDPQLSMVYLSSWLYQPYLDDQTKLLLESLLLETGHRTL
ncbi:cyclin-dependent kinase 2-interacting protein isoform X2 [Sardina pilchardus]|uniref:cyclin-dependent kinase 2-interacting protein isoform X2 n=1 Tax=Sardina pilchardus TaxID=27697 RepID=UPI002E106C35